MARFGRTYREIQELIGKLAILLAPSVVRKSLVRAGGDAGVPRARVIVADWVVWSLSQYAWQWRVDLTNYTRMRMTANEYTVIFYTTDVGSALDPGDWSPLVATRIETGTSETFANWYDWPYENTDDPEKWYEIPEELRRPLRLTPSNADAEPFLFYTFHLMIQAF